MAFIVETIAGDHRIQLGNEDLVRQMSTGTNWQKIRIGLRISFCDPVLRMSNSSLVVGVCQGTQYPFSSINCLDFVGIGWPATFDSNTIEIGTSGGLNVSNYDTSLHYSKIRKVGAALTQTTIANSYTYFSRNPTLNVSVLMLDITKGSPNYTLNYWYQTQAQFTATPNISRAVFLAMMEAEITPSYITGNSQTLAYSGAGLFDSVNIRWGHSMPAIELADISVYQYY